jgi:hypothetical protein
MSFAPAAVMVSVARRSRLRPGAAGLRSVLVLGYDDQARNLSEFFIKNIKNILNFVSLFTGK